MEYQYDSQLKSEDWLKLYDFKNSKEFCDVIILKGTLYIYAHSCVLAAFSPFMRNLFKTFSTHCRSVFRPLKINLTYLTRCKKNSAMNCIRCVEKLVDFLYTGKIAIEDSHLPHLISLSKTLELFSFESVCREFTNQRKSKEKQVICKVDRSHELLCKKMNCSTLQEPLINRRIVVKGHVDFPLVCKEASNSNILFEQFSNPEHSATMDKTSNCTSTDHHSLEYSECTGEYICLKCKLRFTSFKMFEAHKKVFHKRQFICLSCNFITFKLSYIVFHLNNMNHDENCCSICLFQAEDRVSFKLHLHDHKKEFPFKCYDCGNLFKARSLWLRHMVLHNDPEKSVSNYVCEVCGFVATYKSVFERHRLSHDKSFKTLKCPVTPCAFSTYSKYNLQEHMLTHESDKFFVCQICSLKFSQEKNLKRHILALHEPKVKAYKCFRCDYESVRIDKIKGHCHSLHPSDEEALSYVLKQHKNKKSFRFSKGNCKKKLNTNKGKVNESISPQTKLDEISNPINKNNLIEEQAKLVSKSDGINNDSTYILSETSGEFSIISENEGGSISVASVTSTNVLTIGNFRAGTGSVTLNETTGILTFNNINSDSTGAVFLNESTGELSYINLSKDSLSMDIEKNEPKCLKEVITQLDEFTGEIFTVNNENMLPDFSDEDVLFDSFDMDIGNDDSCDGFDDLDGLLFDPIDMDGTNHIDLFISRNETEPLKHIPHLNETTGELSFDSIESQNINSTAWNNECGFDEDKSEDQYRVLLNEFTGEFS